MSSREDDLLPSWDEFGAEQLDYGEGEEEEAAPGAAPTGDDPGDPGEGTVEGGLLIDGGGGYGGD